MRYSCDNSALHRIRRYFGDMGYGECSGEMCALETLLTMRLVGWTDGSVRGGEFEVVFEERTLDRHG